MQSSRKFSVHRHGPLVHIDFRDDLEVSVEYNIWSMFRPLATAICKHITNTCQSKYKVIEVELFYFHSESFSSYPKDLGMSGLGKIFKFLYSTSE